MTGKKFKGSRRATGPQHHNDTVDVIQAYKSGSLTNKPANFADSEDSGVIRIKNESGSNLNQFSILKITGSVFSYSDNNTGYKYDKLFTGDTPAATDLGNFCILLQPLRDDEIGKALVQGVTFATVDILDADHDFCDVKASNTELESKAVGSARILDRTSGTGSKEAKILLGCGGQILGSSFEIELTQTAGSAGNATTQCSFTYTVKDIFGYSLGTTVDPTTGDHKHNRPALGTMVAATEGRACYNASGNLSIRSINEVIDPEACA